MSTRLETLKAIVKELIKKELEEASVTGAIDGGEGPPKTPYAFKKKKKKKDESISEATFHVRVQDLGSVLVDAGSKGEAKMIVAKKLKGGVKKVVSVTRVAVSKAKQVDKKLENVNEVSLNPMIFTPNWEKNFKGYNEKELKVITKLGDMLRGLAPVIKMAQGGAKQDFKRFIKKAAQKGLYESLNEGKYHDYRNDESLTAKQKIGYSMKEVRDKLTELDSLVKMNVRLKNEVGVDSTSYWKRTHVAMKKISERLVKLANKVGQLY